MTNKVAYISRTVQHGDRLRWDKADLSTYSYDTYNKLSQICVPVHFLHCLPGCCCGVQQTIDGLFTHISNILQQSAGVAVPRCKAGFFKPWWTDTLSGLKSASIEAHNIWKEDFYVSKGTTVNIAFLDLSKFLIKSTIIYFSRN